MRSVRRNSYTGSAAHVAQFAVRALGPRSPSRSGANSTWTTTPSATAPPRWRGRRQSHSVLTWTKTRARSAVAKPNPFSAFQDVMLYCLVFMVAFSPGLGPARAGHGPASERGSLTYSVRSNT